MRASGTRRSILRVSSSFPSLLYSEPNLLRPNLYVLAFIAQRHVPLSVAKTVWRLFSQPRECECYFRRAARRTRLSFHVGALGIGKT